MCSLLLGKHFLAKFSLTVLAQDLCQSECLNQALPFLTHARAVRILFGLAASAICARPRCALMFASLATQTEQPNPLNNVRAAFPQPHPVLLLVFLFLFRFSVPLFVLSLRSAPHPARSSLAAVLRSLSQSLYLLSLLAMIKCSPPGNGD